MSSTVFDVYYDDCYAGQLTVDHSMRMAFQYDAGYQGHPISLVMPTSQESYDDSVVFPFVENLFPEGEVRELIMRRNQIAEGNFEKFIQLLGGDVAGTLSFQPEGVKPISEFPKSPDVYDLELLSKTLLDIQERPFLVDERHQSGNRMSLAGAQHKLPVIMLGDKVCSPNGHPTTHFIKPAPKPLKGYAERYPSVVYNEYLCMAAAHRSGINTANVSLLSVLDHLGNESDALLVERYDRIIGDKVHRLHQEDLCQLYSIPSPKKYEADGGPGFNELYSAIKLRSSVPVIDHVEFFHRFLFNLIIGNYDAHGKNYSFMVMEGGNTQLTPTYDVVCTELYPELSDTFAMSINGAKRLNELSPGAMEDFYSSLGLIGYKAFKKKLIAYAKKALLSIQQEVLAFSKGDYYEEDIQQMRKIQSIAERNFSIVMAFIG